MNWNVRLAYIQTISFALGMGIIQVAFSIFVTNNTPNGLGQTNIILGNLFTIQGIASTIFVIPSGIFADRYRRDLLIRISVIFGVLAQVTLIYATTLVGNPQTALTALIVSEILGGIGWGLSGPAGQALIADSIEPGRRSQVFAKMFFANLVASAIGPAIAAGSTLFLGDTWDLKLLQNLILMAAFTSLFAYLAIVFASDNKALVTRIQDSPTSTTLPKEGVEVVRGTPVVTIFGIPFFYEVITPSVIVISGIIIGFGAGATVAFFPILFASSEIGYGLPPFFTYTIMCITSIVTGLAGLLAQRMIRILGRIGSMFFTQGLAIICLVGLMINLVLYLNHTITYSLSVLFLVFFYISRNALMNAAGPVSRSIVMDIVPSASRAKWNSLETLAWGMFWSVSASIGGFIVDNYGFLYVFMFTATLYTIATLLILFIRNRVPKESILTRTYQLGRLKARNRVVMPSSSISGIKTGEIVNGQISYEAISYYRKAAQDGAGLVYIEPAYISLQGKSHPHQIGIHDDYVISRLAQVVEQVHKNGSLIGIRLTHAGGATKKAICGVQPLAPSAIPISDRDPPRSLTLGQISQIRNEFAEAAIRAARAGFDIVEISSSMIQEKPDLLGQFISPEYNKRTDEYGGSFINRIQFPLEVAKAIRATLPQEIMLAYYISAPFRGLPDDELSTVVKYIERAGIELLCIDYLYSEVKDEEVGIERFIQKVKDDLPHIPIVCSGDFDIDSAEQAIKQGQADLVAFGRFTQENLALQLSLR
ncbi:MAG: MFS transporter [Candidatus Heimdallarchaeota archaeon]|nr:MAG: MFS transporter [Candidatus Heimdallarchaeota archaeon]